MNETYLTNLCLCKTHHSLPMLRTTHSILALGLETILNSKVTNKKHKNVKIFCYNDHEITLVDSRRAETKGRVTFYDLSWGLVLGVTQIFLPLCTCLRMISKAPQVLIWGLHVNCSR